LALSTNIPVLGICRGLQVLVVATGGSLIAHLPDEVGEVVIHRAHQSSAIEHSVKIAANSHLAKIVGATELNVFSWHHQAASIVPQEWNVTARAADGVIEALEHKHHPWAIALQWHPELAIDDPLQQRIFQAFIHVTSTKTATNTISVRRHS
jgi:putative glutamine amidotransferase